MTSQIIHHANFTGELINTYFNLGCKIQPLAVTKYSKLFCKTNITRVSIKEVIINLSETSVYIVISSATSSGHRDACKQQEKFYQEAFIFMQYSESLARIRTTPLIPAPNNSSATECKHEQQRRVIRFCRKAPTAFYLNY